MKDYSFTVEQSSLFGHVQLSGAKNSALRLQAASLLTTEKMTLTNFPSNLLDVQVQNGMLEYLGKQVDATEKKVVISQEGTISTELLWEDRSIRNTLLILGALLAHYGKGKVPLPGGCKLGERKYDIHVMIFEAMGARVWEEDNYLCAESKGRLKAAELVLPLRSTGATENAIICGSLAQGITRVWNPHIRPEILDLINMLNKMGARIRVFGQEHIEIRGVEGLHGVDHRVIPDNMEALTWMIASVITNGDIEISNFPFEHLEVPLIHLRESGAKFYKSENDIIVRGGKCYPIDISTGPYPGINSDMQPLFAIYGACARGESKIIDLRFPGRYGYADEIKKMGVNARVDKDFLIINGGNATQGTEVNALDLRAGMALLLLGLVSHGETTINNAWQIERGYEDIITKVRSLGGKLSKSLVAQ
jgi:UDP-N-acetylglucosamine 1-carboxyvinyltransferase